MAVDGDARTNTRTLHQSGSLWWKIVMGAMLTVASVRIRNRPVNLQRLGNILISVDDKPCGPKVNFNRLHLGQRDERIYCPLRPRGRYLTIQLLDASNDGVLTLNKVNAFGYK
eukprot:Ihof_evm1s621 gene=Ihof_evmTU1s621